MKKIGQTSINVTVFVKFSKKHLDKHCK